MNKYAQYYSDNKSEKPAIGSGFAVLLVSAFLIAMCLIAVGALDNSLLDLMPR